MAYFYALVTLLLWDWCWEGDRGRDRERFLLSVSIFVSIFNKGCAQPGSTAWSLHLSPHLCSPGRLSIISLLTFHHSVGGTQSESGDEEKIKEMATELTQACVVCCDWVLEPRFMKLRANLTLADKGDGDNEGKFGEIGMFEGGNCQPGSERLRHNLTHLDEYCNHRYWSPAGFFLVGCNIPFYFLSVQFPTFVTLVPHLLFTDAKWFHASDGVF